ncbi:MAG: MBOAT family protein [Clostridia bacterium]|nr:MBOAT family protein [Clostridia bacterium]
MVFSSLIFLFGFLPLTLLCYYCVPRVWRNLVLFVFSLAFYGWGEPIYLFLMLFAVTSAYLFGFLIEKYKETEPKKAKRALIFSLAVNLFLLLFFKYYPFFAENLSRLPFISLPSLKDLRLPIGISFYTFQIMSYTVDVYRNDCRVQRNYVRFGTYVTLFPQLVAGPIVRYQTIDRELCERRETVDDFASGVSRFCCGLAKKVLVGDALAAGHAYYLSLADFEMTALGAWMTAILFTLHLYYDFSGYSDMAIGLGRMFGFHFPENFNYPYIARSITEFWRRWHISLSTWFREYVYIPLGGNRRGKLRQYWNLAVVWLLTGFWHGANWNFVLWGAYYCVILILEKAFLLRALKKAPRPLAHFYTLFLVVVGFLIFSNTDLVLFWRCFLALFGVGCTAASSATAVYQFRHLLPLILIAAVGATPLPRKLMQLVTERCRPSRVLVPILCTAAFLLSTAYLVDSTYSPFAYTQF